MYYDIQHDSGESSYQIIRIDDKGNTYFAARVDLPYDRSLAVTLADLMNDLLWVLEKNYVPLYND